MAKIDNSRNRVPPLSKLSSPRNHISYWDSYKQDIYSLKKSMEAKSKLTNIIDIRQSAPNVSNLRNPTKRSESRTDKLEEIKSRTKSIKINPG
jgi:hypothetical protein